MHTNTDSGSGSLHDPPEPDQTESVLEIHRAQLREPHDPEEGQEPIPWWLWAVAVAAIFGSGFYVGRYSGSFDASVREVRFGQTPWTALPAGPAPVATLAGVDGAAVYARTCAACHQPAGTGVPGAFPPLAGSAWVSGPDSVMLKIVLRGLTGPVEVKGAVFNGIMPAWASQLNDAELAAVITYVRTSWGNTASPVNAAAVAGIRESTKARSSSWTVSELR